MTKRRFSIPAAACLAALLSASPCFANDPFILNDYAVNLMDKGDVEKAIESLQKAFGMYPYNQSLRKNLAQAYAASGHNLMEKRDFEAAADRYDHARELYPEHPGFLMMRGIALYWAKNLDLSRVELEKSVALKDDPDALYYLGQVYYDNGDLAAAVQSWKKAQALKPEETKLADLVAKATKELTLEPGMDKGASSRFAVTFDVSVKSDMVTKVLDELETAYNRVGSDLGFFPQGQIPVILYTRKSFKEVTDSPDWSGGVFDGKIRIPIGGLSEISKQFRAILVHEYTHAVVHQVTKGNCPIWLNEGLAEYEGRKEYDPPITALPRYVAEGKLIPLSSLEGSFMGLSSAQAVIAYEESYGVVSFMISSYGLHKVKDLLTQLGQGKSITVAVADAFADYQLTYEMIQNEWREYAAKTYVK